MGSERRRPPQGGRVMLQERNFLDLHSSYLLPCSKGSVGSVTPCVPTSTSLFGGVCRGCLMRRRYCSMVNVFLDVVVTTVKRGMTGLLDAITR